MFYYDYYIFIILKKFMWNIVWIKYFYKFKMVSVIFFNVYYIYFIIWWKKGGFIVIYIEIFIYFFIFFVFGGV